jgi:hypothetical protein
MMDEKSRSAKPAHNRSDPVLLLERLKALQLGTLEMASDVFWDGRRSKVITKCRACGKTTTSLTENLLKGRIVRCRCQPVKYAEKKMLLLADRYVALDQRCNNPNSPEYKNYGGRGIKNLFHSAPEFVRWVIENLPHETYKGVQLDRINNNGHYEPGNLRLATSAENNSNKRNNVIVSYLNMEMPIAHVWHVLKALYPEFPYGPATVRRYIESGKDLTVAHLHRRADNSGRKSSTSLTPDLDIVSLYLDI